MLDLSKLDIMAEFSHKGRKIKIRRSNSHYWYVEVNGTIVQRRLRAEDLVRWFEHEMHEESLAS